MVVLLLHLIADVYEVMKHEMRSLQRDMHWRRSQKAMHGEKENEITHARKTRAMATRPKSGGAKM
jgi:hypothetical protein